MIIPPRRIPLTWSQSRNYVPREAISLSTPVIPGVWTNVLDTCVCVSANHPSLPFGFYFICMQVLTNTLWPKFQFFPANNNSHSLWYNVHSPRWTCLNARTHARTHTQSNVTSVVNLGRFHGSNYALQSIYNVPTKLNKKNSQLQHKITYGKNCTQKLTRIFNHVKHLPHFNFPWDRKVPHFSTNKPLNVKQSQADNVLMRVKMNTSTICTTRRDIWNLCNFPIVHLCDSWNSHNQRILRVLNELKTSALC
jgi:hypothetical protein